MAAKYYGLRPGAIAALLLSDAWTWATTRRPKPSLKPGERRKVALVRLDNIGDFVLWRDALRGWRTLYPAQTHELTLIAQSSWATLAEGAAEIDRVWLLDRDRLVRDARYRREQLRAVRRAGFETIVQPRPGREWLREDAITHASGAKQRIGWGRASATLLHKLLSERLYSRLLPPGPAAQNEMERNAEALRALGLTDFKAQVPQLAERAACPPEIAALGPFYVLFPGADWAGRRWPASRFAEIARRLHAHTGWVGVVCGGPDDWERGRVIVAAAGDAPVQDWTGRTTLDTLAAVLRAARLVVSNETGAVHLAASAGTECVCVTGGGHWGRFLPYPPEVVTRAAGRGGVPLPVVFPMPCFGCDWQCIFPRGDEDPTPCVDNVSVDAVWEQVQRAAAVEGAAEKAISN